MVKRLWSILNLEEQFRDLIVENRGKYRAYEEILRSARGVTTKPG